MRNTVEIKTRLNVWLGSDCKIKYGLITLIEYKIGIKRNKIKRWKLLSFQTSGFIYHMTVYHVTVYHSLNWATKSVIYGILGLLCTIFF